MGNFVFTQYSGEDAGRVLVALLSGEEEAIEAMTAHAEIGSKTERVVGFMPEPEPEEDEEDDDE